MQKFLSQLAKFTLIGILLFIFLLLEYVILDPFKVIHTYANYSYSYVVLNRDYVSTEVFTQNKDIHHYNSFIFGSSRTLAFRPSVWQKYLPKQASPFAFDASSESIYGIYTKLKYLDSIQHNINNVLMIVCRDATFKHSQNQDGHLFMKHPLTSRESKIIFHYNFFNAYLEPEFLLSYHQFRLTKKYQDWMAGYINNKRLIIDSITNEINIIEQELAIRQNPEKYYEQKKTVFYERKGEQIDDVIRITPEQVFMLQEIKRILEKNKTNYKVIISPLYEQKKFNKTDFDILKSLFGENLHDYSGKNQFTDDKLNYYEASHYRPHVGDSILRQVYAK
jgi:hypothetical protein